jgi:hypothetical protein
MSAVRRRKRDGYTHNSGNEGAAMIQPRSEGRIELAASEDQAGALCALVRDARHVVRIFSDTLSPDLFDNAELADELSRVARGGRQCEVRILIKDSIFLVKRAHRLGALHRRLPSLVMLRKLADAPENYIANYVLADDGGIFFIPNVDDKICFMNHDDRPLAKHCREQFDDLWQRSVEDPELRLMPM